VAGQMSDREFGRALDAWLDIGSEPVEERELLTYDELYYNGDPENAS